MKIVPTNLIEHQIDPVMQALRTLDKGVSLILEVDEITHEDLMRKAGILNVEYRKGEAGIHLTVDGLIVSCKKGQI